MEQTAKIGVEVEDEVQSSEPTDLVESSPTKEQDQEIDFASMSQSELVEFAKSEREAKERAVGHLREQSKKNRPNLEAIDEAPTEEQPKVTDQEALDARIAKVVAETVEQKLQERSGDYAKGSNDWLMQQSWATPFLPETPGSDPLYAKLFTEVKRLRETHPVTTTQDYQHLLKLAAVTVTGKPDALLQEAPAESDTIRYRKSMSVSPGTSTGKTSQRHFTKEEIAFAKECGHNPEEVYKD